MHVVLPLPGAPLRNTSSRGACRLAVPTRLKRRDQQPSNTALAFKSTPVASSRADAVALPVLVDDTRASGGCCRCGARSSVSGAAVAAELVGGDGAAAHRPRGAGRAGRRAAARRRAAAAGRIEETKAR